jgi:hypothetical protein
VTLSEFLDLAHNKLPVLTGVIAQDLFIKTHQMNDPSLIDKKIDSCDKNYEFNLSHEGHSFKIKFNREVDNKIDPILNQEKKISEEIILSLFKKQSEFSNII